MKRRKWCSIVVIGLVLFSANSIVACGDSTPAHNIAFSPSSLSFSAQEGKDNPPSKPLNVSNSGGGYLDWSLSENADWLILSPTSGTSAGEARAVDVLVDIGAMSAGDYSTAITISAPRASNTPETIAVNLSIVPPSPELSEEQPGELSFTAAQYVNTRYGFSVKYPKDWKEVPAEGWPEAVFYVAAPAQVPVLGVAVQDVENEAAPFADVLTAAAKAAGASGLEIVSETETTLIDGTPVAEAVVKWTVQRLPADTFAVGATKDDKWVIVTITTVSLLAPYDEALFAEIARTLQLVLPPSAYPPKAGTIAVEPARISCPYSAVMDIPIRFTGTDWPANELVIIDLVMPRGVWAPGLDRESDEDSVSIASATADADGDFEVKWPNCQKATWLLRSRIPSAWERVPAYPLPGGRYEIKARGVGPASSTTATIIWDSRPDTVATTTWDLRLR